MASQKHEFALYFEGLADQLQKSPAGNLVVDDDRLVHRMGKVLRLQEHEEVVFFDRAVWVTTALKTVAKNKVIALVQKSGENRPFRPLINWLIPLLDREALEQTLTALAVMGATTISFVETEKTQGRFALGGERIHRLMVAAVEQSKQFVLPVCDEKVQKLAVLLEKHEGAGPLLFFDPAGISMASIIDQFHHTVPPALTCLVGPEGDLTEREKSLLRAKKVTFAALTPSILRTEVAVTVAMGILRSCVRQDV